MRLRALCAAACAVAASAHLLLDPQFEALFMERPALPSWAQSENVPGGEPRFLNNVTSKFYVDGAAVPEVPFDIGESYAGRMPLSPNADERQKMFFWFFPMDSKSATDGIDVIIWLNGGPGCSSMTGLLTENGPFLWIPGTFRPVRNPWSWHRLAHVVYVDQPIGTGYSTGPRTFVDEHGVARDFVRFWRQFVDTFQLHGAKVYVTGESYAGMYIPYIATHMLDLADAGEHAYFNIQGSLIYDPLFANLKVQADVPAMRYIERTRLLHPFDNATMTSLRQDDLACGFSAYLDKFLTFPPPEEWQPPIVPGTGVMRCEMLRYRIIAAARKINPCWDMYNVAATCPFKWSALGPELYSQYQPEGADTYFNRSDVRQALNIESSDYDYDDGWAQCRVGIFASGQDHSLPSSAYALPDLIDRTGNVVLVHGKLDFILIDQGTLLAIQNMTWGAMRGFQSPPIEPLVVPTFDQAAMLGPVAGNVSAFEPVDLSGAAGVGTVGIAHSERGLVYVGVELSGHMGPQTAPAVAMRLVESLIGRVVNLSSHETFWLERQ